MNFCSHCGSAGISYIIPERDSYHRFVCNHCGKVFYDNPRIIVGCLVEDHDQLLLCRRAIKPQLGLWNLPAGFLENGENVEEGAARETREESRANVEIIKLHAVYSLPRVNQVYLHFFAKMVGGDIGTTSESSEVRFFNPKDIPWSEIAFHSTTYALKKFLEYGRDHKGVHVGSHENRATW